MADPSSWVERAASDAKTAKQAGADQTEITKNLYRDVQSGLGVNGQTSQEGKSDLHDLNQKLHASGILPHLDIVGTDSKSQTLVTSNGSDQNSVAAANNTGSVENTSSLVTNASYRSSASPQGADIAGGAQPVSDVKAAGVTGAAPAGTDAAGAPSLGSNIASFAKADADAGREMWKDDNVTKDVGCAASVSAVLRQSGVNIDQLNTKGLAATLKGMNFTASSTPHPGDVVIGERGSGQHGHTGIVGEGGVVYDNNSDTGKFTRDPLNSFNTKEFKAGVTYYTPPGGSSGGPADTAGATDGTVAAAPGAPGAPGSPGADGASSAAPTDSNLTKSSMSPYTVVSGDNLSSIIARQNPNASPSEHKQMLADVIAANKGKYPGLESNPDLILPDWQLQMPSENAGTSASGSANNLVSKVSFDQPIPSATTSDAAGGGANMFNPKADEKQKAQQLMDMLVQKGLSAAGAAGVVGNFMRESSLIPDRNEDGGGPGYGLAQWGGGRRTALESRPNSNTASTQVDFLMDELKGTAGDGEPNHAGLLSELEKTNDATQAAKDFVEQFERAGTVAMNERTQGAQDVLADYEKRTEGNA